MSIEKKVCSGDTTTGLQRQIGEWASASSANLATLTMGGNDLGFSDIVWYCMAAEDKARALMNDQGESGLRYKPELKLLGR